MRGFLALVMVAAIASRMPAQSALPKVGTILIAHGADTAWNARVLDMASAVRTGGPVEVSFLMGRFAAATRFQDAVGRLEEQGVDRIAVVPVLVSSYSGHYDQIRWLVGEDVALDEAMRHHLHMAGITRPVTRVPLRLTRAMDDSPLVARVIADRALALASTPSQHALFIVGHGPNSAEDHAEWMRNLRALADSVRQWTPFRDVKVDVVRDDAPAAVRSEAVLRIREMITMQHHLTQRDVIVVPLLVSKGQVSRDRLPRDLAGLPVVYGGEPLLPHPHMSRWVEARVREVTQLRDLAPDAR